MTTIKKYEGMGDGFTQPDPTIKEFMDRMNRNIPEITIDGETVNAHKPISATVRVRCVNNDEEYELIGIDIDMLIGCGCWSGIVLEIKQISNT